MAARQTVEHVLEEIGLHGLLSNFQSQKIEFYNLLNLSDNELSRLGVSTIGDRVRLREKVRTLGQRQEVQGGSGESSGINTNRNVGDIRAGQERNLLFSRPGRSSRKRKNSELHRPWTVTVVCLSDKKSVKVPSSDVKEMLMKAGLGCKRIQFNSEENLLEKICSNEKNETNEIIGFPKLKDCGGFELLRCQANSRSLKVIDCSWTIKGLRKFLGTQAKIYVRPIQQNLSTEPLQAETVDADITEQCRQCGQTIKVKNLRSHCEEECLQSQIPNEISLEGDQVVTSLTLDTNTFVVVTSENVTEVNEGVENSSQLLLSVQPDVQSAYADTDIEQSNNFFPIEPHSNDVLNTFEMAVEHMINHRIEDPIEILRYLQSVIVTGRQLDIDTTDNTFEGETNFINVDRQNILETSFDEIKCIQNPRLTLEVQFYDEMAQDLGGPRKEFFQQVLGAIKEKYFDNGLREHMKEDYITIGKIFSMSILQNGKIPVFINDYLEQIFSLAETNSECIKNLRTGFDWLGLYTVGLTLPSFTHILRPTSTSMTVRMLTHLLCPAFSETGSNSRAHESKMYAAFTRYMREAAGGRRGPVTLSNILKFVTGAEEEPMLGFRLHPTIMFPEVSNGFVPTANTCANT